jgi:hypothetical protein
MQKRPDRRLSPTEAKALHAFGVDDVACAFLALRQIVFFAWVILNEHKWVILGERRGLTTAFPFCGDSRRSRRDPEFRRVEPGHPKRQREDDSPG